MTNHHDNKHRLLKVAALSLAIVLSAGSFNLASAQLKDPKSILENTLKEIKKVNTMTYNFKREERIGLEWVEGQLFCKLQEEPVRKCYVKNTFPDAGSEVLWVEGQRKGKALVYPGKFPYVNLKLDPHGDIMLKKKHHSTHELGFLYFHRIASALLDKHGHEIDKYVTLKGGVAFNGRACYHLEVDYTPFAFVNYTVKANEDLWDIGKNLVVYEQMIIDKNSSVDDFDDVSEGDVILVPNAYARKIVLYIDMTNNLPIMQEVYDLKGKLARYEYSNVRVNPVLKDEEFTADYPDYNF